MQKKKINGFKLYYRGAKAPLRLFFKTAKYHFAFVRFAALRLCVRLKILTEAQMPLNQLPHQQYANCQLNQ
jgi:hypothetical protein